MKQVRDISLHPNLILFIQNNSYFYLIKKIEQDRDGMGVHRLILPSLKKKIKFLKIILKQNLITLK